jgi:hypothetical protein
MMQDTSIQTVGDNEAHWSLPRRDYILLPAIFIMTILFILAGAEATIRLIYVQADDPYTCRFITQAGYRYHPDCTSHNKVWEGSWITEHFNECGYRSAESCAPRPPGSLRVVVVGSSTARGASVNYDDSFAARASAALSEHCGDVVDFQDLGTEAADVDRIDLRIPEAMRLRPAAIVMTVGPYDLQHLKDPPPLPDGSKPPKPFDLVNRMRESRLFLFIEYYLFRDPAAHARAFLLKGDSADYVRTPLSPVWQHRVQDFGDLLARIVAGSGSVPVSLFYIPERPQVALAGRVADPPDVDPFVVGAALERVAAPLGVRFTDTTRALGAAPDFQSLFYTIEGHANAGGHAVIASDVEQALLAEPAFARCTQR